MRQLTLAGASFDKHSKQTRRAKFLAEMDQVVPWRELCALVAPFYPKAGNGRAPIGLERMLRLHFLQHCWGRLIATVESSVFPTSDAYAGCRVVFAVDNRRRMMELRGGAFQCGRRTSLSQRCIPTSGMTLLTSRQGPHRDVQRLEAIG
jgi:hypothetical protein